MPMLETYPAGSPEYFNAAGESESDALAEALSVRVTVPPWDRPSGETQRQFKSRFYAACDRAYAEHVQAGKEWTERQQIDEPLYIDGLAMWQAGRTLSEIHSLLAERGLNVGRNPKDSDYNSAISKGLDRVADCIRLDRR
jgi:hypothetical protein